MRGSYAILFALALSVLISIAARGGLAVSAQTPAPIWTWPYRVVVSGPVSAAAGDEVTYRINYDLINMPDGLQVGPMFVFLWLEEAASLVSSQIVEGPDGFVSEATERSVRWDFSGTGSGAVEVVLLVRSRYLGDFRVGIDLVGSSLRLPDGSVDGFTVTVVESAGPSLLPSTGGVKQDHGGGLTPTLVLLALGGVAALAFAAAPLIERLRRTPHGA